MTPFPLLSPTRRRRRRDHLDTLRRIPGLAGADSRRLAELAPHTDRLRLLPGRTLVEAGTAAREVIVILDGEAAALRPDGGWTVLRAGTQIGAAELLAGGRHPATVVATFSPEVVVLSGPAYLAGHRDGLVHLPPARPEAPRRRPSPTPAPVAAPEPVRDPAAAA
jgi:hypothetical protein